MNILTIALFVVSVIISIVVNSVVDLFAVAMPVSVGVLAFMAIFFARRQNNISSTQTIFKVTIFSQLLLMVLFVTSSVLEVDWTEGGKAAVVIGSVMIVLGNVMPRTKPNGAFGLRLPWTMKSEIVWRKSNRFAGTMLLFAGVVLISLSLLLTSFAEIILVVTLVSVVFVSSVKSYIYYKNECNQSAV